MIPLQIPHEFGLNFEFRFWGLFHVLGHDMFFPEIEVDLSHDLLGVARQLPCDGLCKVWERIIVI